MPIVIYLTIIPRTPVGYEMIDSQRGAFNHFISNRNSRTLNVMYVERSEKW